jgi:hypothetical protein
MTSCGQNTNEDITTSIIRQQTNERIYDRNIPSQVLQPYVDVRPVMTKYSYLPIVDPRKQPIHPKLTQMPTYNVHATFNPGNTQSPWSGYASNVNTESVLRNQIYALQKCSQAVYVPNSNSDMYSYGFQSPAMPNPHGLLYQNERFENFNPNPEPKIIGTLAFYNATRSQVKDLTKEIKNRCS